MICVNLSAPAAVTAGSVIPFNNVVCATNGGASLVNNAVRITVPGWYTIGLYAALSSTTAVSPTISLNAQTEEIAGASITVDVAENGTSVVALEFPIQVITSQTGIASITSESSAAVTIDSATMIIKRVS